MYLLYKASRKMFACLLFFVFVFCQASCAVMKNNVQDDQLLAVVALFRHGDRSPTKSFPNDRYFHESYWPMGYGQLTNAGKMRMYELGRWFRKRYRSFLLEVYSPKHVYVRSTDTDRCLMSAYSVLAGLFPPKHPSLWNKDILWQPIPVHTVPRQEDKVLSMSKECPKYVNLLNKTMNSEYVETISSKYCDFFNHVSKYTGWNKTDISLVATLQTVLDVYTSYNPSYIPPWAKLLDKKTLFYLAGVNHQRYTQTPELKRLLTGPFWSNFISHFDNVIGKVAGTPKFLMLSAHDTTIVSILNCMGVFDFVPPSFGAALIWEMKKKHNGTYYINLFYKKSKKQADVVSFDECGVDCQYESFKEMVVPMVVDGVDWVEECEDVQQLNKSRPDKKPFFA